MWLSRKKRNSLGVLKLMIALYLNNPDWLTDSIVTSAPFCRRNNCFRGYSAFGKCSQIPSILFTFYGKNFPFSNLQYQYPIMTKFLYIYQNLRTCLNFSSGFLTLFEVFQLLDWSPECGELFGKTSTCLYLLSQLRVHIRANAKLWAVSRGSEAGLYQGTDLLKSTKNNERNKIIRICWTEGIISRMASIIHKVWNKPGFILGLDAQPNWGSDLICFEGWPSPLPSPLIVLDPYSLTFDLSSSFGKENSCNFPLQLKKTLSETYFFLVWEQGAMLVGGGCRGHVLTRSLAVWA